VFDTFRDPRVKAKLSFFHSPPANDLVLLVAMVTAVYLIASASWYLFETPILGLKSRFRSPAPSQQTATAKLSTASDLSL
jgi:peptidoglycan/LPS O-acetylase OafA/YrhL